MKTTSWILKTLLLGAFLTACSEPSNNPGSGGSENPQKTPQIQTVLDAESSRKDFPAIWWQEVPKDQAKSWEILPQDAGPGEVVLSKRNELGILSNFTEAPFVFRGVCYPTIEAFWQMMKYPESEDDIRWSWTPKWKYTRETVSQMDGFKAKSAGSYANKLMEANDANWVTFEGEKIPFVQKTPGKHHDLILNALIEKIRQNPKAMEILLKTKDLKLLPDHEISPKAAREWHYYSLWMDIRSDIQKGKLDKETSEDISLRTCNAN